MLQSMLLYNHGIERRPQGTSNSSLSKTTTGWKLITKKQKKRALALIVIGLIAFIILMNIINFLRDQGTVYWAKYDWAPKSIKSRANSRAFSYCHHDIWALQAKRGKLTLEENEDIGSQYNMDNVKTQNVMENLNKKSLDGYFTKLFKESDMEELMSGSSLEKIVSRFNCHRTLMSDDLQNMILEKLGITELIDENGDLQQSEPKPLVKAKTKPAFIVKFSIDYVQRIWMTFFKFMAEKYDTAISSLSEMDQNKPIDDLKMIDKLFDDGYNCTKAYNQDANLGENIRIAVAIRTVLWFDLIGMYLKYLAEKT